MDRLAAALDVARAGGARDLAVRPLRDLAALRAHEVGDDLSLLTLRWSGAPASN